MTRDETIIAALQAGVTLRDAGEPHGISRQRVQQIAKIYGVKPRRSFEFFTPDEIKRAVTLYKDCELNCAETARRLGRSYNAVWTILVRLRVFVSMIDPWSAGEDKLLAAHYGKKSAREIAALIGRNRNKVIGRAYRLGLSRRSRARRHLDLQDGAVT